MKKNHVIILAIFTIAIGGCFLFRNINSSRETDRSSKVKFSSGIYYNKIWHDEDKQLGEIDIICVPDMESAIQISNTIFHNLQDREHFSDFVLQSVFYDEVDEVWIVSYAKDIEQDGNDCSIAISAKTAAILKVWAGE